MRAVLTTIADFFDDASEFLQWVNSEPAFLGIGLYRKNGWGGRGPLDKVIALKETKVGFFGSMRASFFHKIL
jgi:hypothetical protein